jgi:hypothetical protein
MIEHRLIVRLRNWGNWLGYDAQIGPNPPCCISIESRHVPDLGEVWDDPEPPSITPDVADAEAMQQIIRKLDCIEQHCLALRYGGLPCVMKWKRVSEVVMNRMADNAEILLMDMLRKSA